jgi:hypothetical protein
VFPDFFIFNNVKARAWVDSLCSVGAWLDGDHGAGVNEDSGGTELHYAIRFLLTVEVVPRVIVHCETMGTE